VGREWELQRSQSRVNQFGIAEKNIEHHGLFSVGMDVTGSDDCGSGDGCGSMRLLVGTKIRPELTYQFGICSGRRC
jgi:hypothetical protein